MREWQGSAI
jgi:hypothetical protein